MHVRAITKAQPAPAQDIVTVLDVATYILNIVTQITNLFTHYSQKNEV